MRSSETGSLEMVTDDLGRFSFSGLPAATYTVEVLAGQAHAANAVMLPSNASFRANFSLDPERDAIVCRLPAGFFPQMDESLFSVVDPSEARMLRMPVTRRGR